jgi:hypothetical protein
VGALRRSLISLGEVAALVRLRSLPSMVRRSIKLPRQQHYPTDPTDVVVRVEGLVCG